jgi:hypothetical protein
VREGRCAVLPRPIQADDVPRHANRPDAHCRSYSAGSGDGAQAYG